MSGGRQMYELRPPLPPFGLGAALAKVQAAEDEWNTCDPLLVSRGCAEDCVWCIDGKLVAGRAQIADLLTRQWRRERDFSLRRSLWAYAENRIALRVQYECRDGHGRWRRSHGNELWEYGDDGMVRRYEASLTGIPIDESERRFFGPRAEEHRGLVIP